MRRTLAALLAIGLLASLTQSASPIGLGREGTGFGKLGSMGKGKAAAIVPSCNGTGLIFTLSCNSQYIGAL